MIDDGAVVGTVRENKLMAAVIDDRSRIDQSVSTIMEGPATILDAHEDIAKAIEQLRKDPMIVVSEFGKPSGVMTRHDVLEYL